MKLLNIVLITIDNIYRVAVLACILFVGTHISNLVSINKEVIQKHQEVTKENKTLNEQQIKILQEGKLLDQEQIKLIQECKDLLSKINK